MTTITRACSRSTTRWSRRGYSGYDAYDGYSGYSGYSGYLPTEQERLPNSLRRRVRRFYEFMWLYFHGNSSLEARDDYLKELPTGLRVDITVSLFAHILARVPLFATCSPDTIAMLAQRLKPVVYMPDEIVLKQGLVGSSMYFIEKVTKPRCNRHVTVCT